MKQKTSSSKAPLTKIFYIAIVGFMIIQVLQTIIMSVRVSEMKQDPTNTVLSFLSFSVILPLFLLLVAWFSVSKKQRSKQAFFNCCLVVIGMISIIIGFGNLSMSLLPPFVGNYWMISFAAPLTIVISIVVIMIRRLRMRGEW